MKEFQFTLKLVGCGEDAKEAWHDVLENTRMQLDDYSMPEDPELIDEWKD